MAISSAQLDPKTPFREAAEWWLQSRQIMGSKRVRYVAPRTLRDLEQYVRALNRFFAELPLNEIHIGHFAEYQRMRSLGELGPQAGETKPDGWKEGTIREVGPNKINQELGTLTHIMQRYGVWTAELAELYEPLQHEEADIPRALSPAEQERFLDVAASRRDWEFIHWYALLAIQTCARQQELRYLKLGDINLYEGIVYIRRGSAKNARSIRTIPLTAEGKFAAIRLAERAHGLGSTQPQHYLFPLRMARNAYDPTRPMTESGVKRSWNEVRLAAGVPWFRPYDTRHTGLTRLAEAGLSAAYRKDIAGHITDRMEQHYVHLSEQAKRRAVETAFPSRPVQKPRCHATA